MQIVRHGRFAATALFDLVLGNGQEDGVGGNDLHFLIVFRFQHASDRFAIGQFQDHAIVAFCDLGVGKDDRFEQVFARLLGADPGDFGADVAAGAVEFVALYAGDFGLVKEDVPAAFGIAADEGFAPGGEWIVVFANRLV